MPLSSEFLQELNQSQIRMSETLNSTLNVFFSNLRFNLEREVARQHSANMLQSQLPRPQLQTQNTDDQVSNEEMPINLCTTEHILDLSTETNSQTHTFCKNILPMIVPQPMAHISHLPSSSPLNHSPSPLTETQLLQELPRPPPAATTLPHERRFSNISSCTGISAELVEPQHSKGRLLTNLPAINESTSIRQPIICRTVASSVPTFSLTLKEELLDDDDLLEEENSDKCDCEECRETAACEAEAYFQTKDTMPNQGNENADDEPMTREGEPTVKLLPGQHNLNIKQREVAPSGEPSLVVPNNKSNQESSVAVENESEMYQTDSVSIPEKSLKRINDGVIDNAEIGEQALDVGKKVQIASESSAHEPPPPLLDSQLPEVKVSIKPCFASENSAFERILPSSLNIGLQPRPDIDFNLISQIMGSLAEQTGDPTTTATAPTATDTNSISILTNVATLPDTPQFPIIQSPGELTSHVFSQSFPELPITPVIVGQPEQAAEPVGRTNERNERNECNERPKKLKPAQDSTGAPKPKSTTTPKPKSQSEQNSISSKSTSNSKSSTDSKSKSITAPESKSTSKRTSSVRQSSASAKDTTAASANLKARPALSQSNSSSMSTSSDRKENERSSRKDDSMKRSDRKDDSVKSEATMKRPLASVIRDTSHEENDAGMYAAKRHRNDSSEMETNTTWWGSSDIRVLNMKCFQKDCDLFFTDRSKHTHHILDAHNLRPIICPLLHCSESFFSKACWQNHVSEAHRYAKPRQRWKCKSCLREHASDWSLWGHFVTCHQEGHFQCACCSFSDRFKTTVINHYTQEHYEPTFQAATLPQTRGLWKHCPVAKCAYKTLERTQLSKHLEFGHVVVVRHPADVS